MADIEHDGSDDEQDRYANKTNERTDMQETSFADMPAEWIYDEAENLVPEHTVDHTRDEFGEDRWFVADAVGDWIGESHPTRELAQDECDRLNAP